MKKILILILLISILFLSSCYSRKMNQPVGNRIDSDTEYMKYRVIQIAELARKGKKEKIKSYFGSYWYDSGIDKKIEELCDVFSTKLLAIKQIGGTPQIGYSGPDGYANRNEGNLIAVFESGSYLIYYRYYYMASDSSMIGFRTFYVAEYDWDGFKVDGLSGDTYNDGISFFSDYDLNKEDQEPVILPVYSSDYEMFLSNGGRVWFIAGYNGVK